MRKLYVILLFFSLLFSISCNSYKYGANAEPTQKSNLTFGVVKSKIIKGNTTQSEILEIFGAPNLVSKNKSNNEVWSREERISYLEQEPLKAVAPNHSI